MFVLPSRCKVGDAIVAATLAAARRPSQRDLWDFSGGNPVSPSAAFLIQALELQAVRFGAFVAREEHSQPNRRIAAAAGDHIKRAPQFAIAASRVLEKFLARPRPVARKSVDRSQQR